MAVQKSKKSRSRRGMRRSHDGLSTKCLSIDKVTGETCIRHHMTPDGYFKGRQVISFEEEVSEEQE